MVANRGIDALGVARGPRTVSRQNEMARVISLPGRLTPVSWQLPNHLSYEDWLHYGKMLTQMQGAIQWALGDWWVHGEHKYDKSGLRRSGTAPLAPMLSKL